MISRELEQYYSERFNMMATQGWQDLIEDAEKMIETYDNVSAIETIENLHFKKGQLDILRWLVSLKQTSEEVFKEIEHEKNV